MFQFIWYKITNFEIAFKLCEKRANKLSFERFSTAFLFHEFSHPHHFRLSQSLLLSSIWYS